MVKKRQTFK